MLSPFLAGIEQRPAWGRTALDNWLLRRLPRFEPPAGRVFKPLTLAFSNPLDLSRGRVSEWNRCWTVPEKGGVRMVALLVLLLILAVFGGFGFAAHFLWIVLIAALVLWAIGFLVGGIEAGGGRRRWYGR
jgi:hypothetical protein